MCGCKKNKGGAQAQSQGVKAQSVKVAPKVTVKSAITKTTGKK